MCKSDYISDNIFSCFVFTIAQIVVIVVAAGAAAALLVADFGHLQHVTSHKIASGLDPNLLNR